MRTHLISNKQDRQWQGILRIWKSAAELASVGERGATLIAMRLGDKIM
jgi:hypothetical protein